MSPWSMRGRPARRGRGHELGTFRRAALHLHHMRDGMRGPAIPRVARHGLPPRRFGPRVVAAFLQPEGMHAEQEAVAGHVGGPARQDARDAVAQHLALAEEEIPELGELHREQVGRMLDRDAAPGLGGGLQFAIGPLPRAGDVGAFPRIGPRREPFRRREAPPQLRIEGLVRDGGEDAGAERMTHHAVGLLLEQRIDLGDRIGLVGVQLRDRDVEPARGGGVAGQRVAADVGCHWRRPFLRW